MPVRRLLLRLLCGLALAAPALLPRPGLASPAGAPAAQAAAPATIPVYTYQVVRTYPHDLAAFTQGLFYQDGFLYESTGLHGRSSVRQVRLETGEVLRKTDLPQHIFGEGSTAWGDRLIVLSWQSQTGFVLDLHSFAVTQRFAYPGEGWGLTHDGRQLIMSDGSAELRFLDPQTLREVRRLRVTAGGRPVDRLNELEWMDGEVLANVWQTDRIARIDPQTGHVTGWIDLAGILPAPYRIANYTDVLNGIAYDAAGQRLFVTGKLWPRLFEIRLFRQPAAAAR
jgi:glutamine cyclotransferase